MRKFEIELNGINKRFNKVETFLKYLRKNANNNSSGIYYFKYAKRTWSKNNDGYVSIYH